MAVSAPSRHRFSTAELGRMLDTGLFQEDDRLELIDGEIIDMTPIGRRHVACVNRLTRLLSQLPEHEVIISVQNPVQLDDYNELQPDIAVLRYSHDYYEQALPAAGDVLLVIEVCETSAFYDIAPPSSSSMPEPVSPKLGWSTSTRKRSRSAESPPGIVTGSRRCIAEAGR